MSAQQKHNSPREGLRKKAMRLFDEWSLSLLILMFGATCFLMGAAAFKWFGEAGS